MDIQNLMELKGYVDEAKKFSRSIDSDNFYFNKKTTKNIAVWETNGFTVEQAVIGDIFNWLCYLGLGDGFIADEEVTFINFCLDLKFTKEDISNLTNSNLRDNYKDYLPISFIFFHEADIIEEGMPIANKLTTSTRSLFNLFGELGKSFIRCDGIETFEELAIYEEYMEILDERLRNLTGDLNLKNVLSISHGSAIDTHGKNINELLEELNSLVALDNLKSRLYSQFNFIQIHRIREAMGLKEPPFLLNSIFLGNSGTGKSTVARLLSQIYFKMGLISKGHIKEINADDLIDYSTDEINEKLQDAIHESIGGILVINEPYKISSKIIRDRNDSFSQFENYNDDLIIILTGNKDSFNDFQELNLDLKDNFNIFYFDDYSSDELHDILVKMMCDSNLKLDLDTNNFFKKYIDEKHKNNKVNFSNANEIKNLFNKIHNDKFRRIERKINISDTEFNRIIPEDIYNRYGRENVEKVMYQIIPNFIFDEMPKGELKFINIDKEDSFLSSNRVTYTHNSKELNVEGLVKEYYEERGYFAIESENDYWWMIYGLLFWDIIFMKTDTCTSVPMNDPRFEEKYSLLKSNTVKDMPKDFFKSTFFKVREEHIKKRFRELMKSNISKEIEKSYYGHFGENCRPINDWNKFTLNDLTISSRLLLKKQLLCIMLRLILNFNDNRKGFPDLIVFNNSEFFFVEVKSENDRPSKEQIECHNFLMNKVKVDVIIFSVNKTKRQIGNMKKLYH